MTDLSLNDTTWREFKFIDIFNIVDGYYNKKPPQINGKIPFLGATQYTNGITGFYSEETILKWDKVGRESQDNVDKRIFPKNCIAITNNGSVGKAYYQEHRFTSSHDITPVYLKENTMNRYLALFLIPLIEKSGESFEYAKKWRPKRMRKSHIMLPIDQKGNPDWFFMENYMKQIEAKMLRKAVSHFDNKLAQLKDTGKGSAPRWGEVRLEDIFDVIQRGKRLVKSSQMTGSSPYISSTATTNGVDNFINNHTNNVRRFDHCITIANSGSVGAAFYHPYSFIASDHVTILKNNKATRYSYLFIVTALSKLGEKYAFNREMNDRRIKREKIILPVDSNNQPDWQYMEKYMKELEIQKVAQWLKR